MEKKKLIPREILKQFIKENNLKTAEDAKDLVKDLFADTIQGLLEAEMDHSLGYEKNDVVNKDTDNRRNGHSKKTVRSDFGVGEHDLRADEEEEPAAGERRPDGQGKAPELAETERVGTSERPTVPADGKGRPESVIRIAEVARETGLAKNTVLNLYHDRVKKVDYTVLDKLCIYLDCQPGDLLVYIKEEV